MRENISSTTWVISSAIPAMLKSSFRTPCIAYAPCATTLSHICEKLRNFCPPDEYFSQLVPPMLSFHTSRFQSSLWQSSYSIVHTPFRTPNFMPHLRCVFSSFLLSAAACIPCLHTPTNTPQTGPKEILGGYDFSGHVGGSFASRVKYALRDPQDQC